MSPLIAKASASSPMRSLGAGACPFRLAVINDEITQDFEKACQIVSVDFGLLGSSCLMKAIEAIGTRVIPALRERLAEVSNLSERLCHEFDCSVT
jgi:hypothetical protein